MSESVAHSITDKAAKQGTLIRALAMSCPAFSVAVASAVCLLPSDGAFSWLGVSIVLLLGVAAVVSYIGLARLNPTVVPANFAAVQTFLAEQSSSRWSAICRLSFDWANQACHWILPAIWLATTATIASYLAGQIWPQLSMGSPWVAVASIVVLGLGLSYLPFRGLRGIVAINLATAAMQGCGLIVFLVFVVIAWRGRSQSPPVAWTLDSTGTPTQYVQDAVPDTTGTNADPSATIPKVDSTGSPIWVYEAADGKGKPLVDAGGSPIIVPTDANGRLAALPSGAAKAVPQENRISPTSADSAFSYSPAAGQPSYSSPPAPVPIEQRFVNAEMKVGMFTLVIFQFMASMGPVAKFKRRGARLLVVGLFVLPPLSVFWLFGYVWKFHELNSYTTSASASSAPIGDVIQLVGGWAFGSANAGWWVAVFEFSLLLLTLITSMWMSFQTGAGVLDGTGCDGMRAVNHRRILPCAGVAILLSAVGAFATAIRYATANTWETSNFKTWLTDTAVGRLSYGMTMSGPDLLSIISLSGSLAVLVLCTLICLTMVWAIWVRPKPMSAFRTVIPAIGAFCGIVLIGYFLASPFFLIGEGAKESIGAIILCVVWACGIAASMFLRKHDAA